jgi:ketosteroid isomerase-like protein
MENREIILKLTEAFDTYDQKTILNHIADDVEWNMLGESLITGKENMAAFFNEHSSVKILSSSKDHIVVDGDQVAVDGEMKCIGPDNKIHEMYYCDIYELENSKVKKLISYTVNKKKAE